jgi:alpha-amylase
MTAAKTLALAIHFHQPVGNLDDVVRRATDRCYRPFLEVLARHPALPATLHYSGCLLEWLEERAPDVTDLLAELAGRKQVELMTGGLYEPILAALPRRDQVGQIRALTAQLSRRFGADPRGLWLTERVWEPDIVDSLTEAGVAYTVLDDTMFHSVGIADDDMRGPFVTEYEGRPLLVYPGDRNLRYLIPYKRTRRVIDYLRSAPSDRLFVYGDDGEKFGEWPDTHERVYEQGWLESFFSELEAQGDWLHLTTLGEHAASAEPAGRVYLPSSSYDEMMTWALPTEARLKLGRHRRRLQAGDPHGVLGFVRGAPWRAFLAKYPEMNQLQKRMLRVAEAVHAAGEPGDSLRELYRAQCNCSYWHGSFGGVYLAFMRAALWHHLMRAESALGLPEGVERIDLDADYRDEFVVRAAWGAAVVSPHERGALLELDDHAFGANLLASMTRYREAYHVEDENAEPDGEDGDDEMGAAAVRGGLDTSQLTFDETRRAGLIDRVGGALVPSYDARLDGSSLVLDADAAGVRIVKRMDAGRHGLRVRYSLTSPEDADTTFSTASSVLPLCLGRETPVPEIVRETSGLLVGAPEGEVGLRIAWDVRPEVSHSAIETHSATLEGLMPMRQGAEVTLTWPLALEAGQTFEVALELSPVVSDRAGGKKDPGVSA